MIFKKDKEFKLENKIQDLGYLINLKTETPLNDDELKKLKNRKKNEEDRENKEENKEKINH